MHEHVILLLAANPRGTSPLQLAEECAEIQRELKLAPLGGGWQAPREIVARRRVASTEVRTMQIDVDTEILETMFAHAATAARLASYIDEEPRLVFPCCAQSAAGRLLRSGNEVLSCHVTVSY